MPYAMLRKERRARGEVSLGSHWLSPTRPASRAAQSPPLMAVKYLRPRMSFERIYAAVSPSRRSGAGSGRVARALRSLGVRVETRTDLAFDAICAAIDDGSPVLVCFHAHVIQIPITGSSSISVTARRPDSLFVVGRGIPFISRNRIARRRFEHLWSPAGAGLVCAKRPSI